MRAAWEGLEAQAELTRSFAALEAGAGYLDLVEAELRVRFATEYEAMLAELATYVSDRASAGGASEADADRVRARLSNAQAQISDARSRAASAMSQLVRVLGVAPARLELTQSIDGFAAPRFDRALDLARMHTYAMVAAAWSGAPPPAPPRAIDTPDTVIGCTARWQRLFPDLQPRPLADMVRDAVGAFRKDLLAA